MGAKTAFLPLLLFHDWWAKNFTIVFLITTRYTNQSCEAFTVKVYCYKENLMVKKYENSSMNNLMIYEVQK